MSSTCFVTVGSTRFDSLTNEILSDAALTALKKLGVTKVSIQLGSGEFEAKRFEEIFGSLCDHDSGSAVFAGLKIDFYRYKPSIAEDLADAKFVIGHAGAGTVIECLRLKKPLIVVVNELLMDNHQAELAAKLADLNHVLYCVPSDLTQTMLDSRLFTLQPYALPEMAKVARHIDRLMGVPA
ncbi:algn-13 [Pristionchus pacificus]|uniref:UDP-N-acetylglucosamine transferase subunit ALG13 n=1 Tax=Pristionchus pacificus TaxID=54126 RepID=A0A2A6BWN8_PRIPA|nr:algn-13 [Pristionchus pacificus]|eukprot:PDM70334.1 algn-13 [Pristionchus pacificus]